MRGPITPIICFIVGAGTYCFIAVVALSKASADQIPVVLSELGVIAGAGGLTMAGAGSRRKQSDDADEATKRDGRVGAPDEPRHGGGQR